MSSLVLSLSLVVVALSPSDGGGQMSQKDWNAYRLVTPSIVSIVRGRQSIGTAALVDSSGLFLAHFDSVYGKRVTAKLSDGRTVSLTLKAEDEPTQLAILQADDWIKSARPLVPAEGLKSGDQLMAVLPSGLIRAEYVGGMNGLEAKSRRLMMLSEISFEAPADRIGGGLVITPAGQLVGFLNAALHSGQEANIQARPSQEAGVTSDAAPLAASRYANSIEPQAKTLRPRVLAQGPADMTVAYTPSLKMLRRTIDSLVHGKIVDRPSIGVDVKNSPDHDGALIEKVEPGSAADQAGLKAGDIVVEINGKDVDNQMDLAKIIMDQQIGAQIIVKAKRGQNLLIVPVVVGSKPAKNHIGPGSST